MTRVVLPAGRLPRWVENFAARHDGVSLSVGDGVFRGTGNDGSSFRAELPFSRRYAGAATVEDVAAACAAPEDWGVLLVRKGGFAVARLAGMATTGSKVGQRHVQGRTKAGGQSQQRFARRRENQARAAYEAAADHAARLLAGVPVLVVGGDHGAVETVLSDARLDPGAVVGEFLTVPDPRRSVLEEAVLDAAALTIEVVNA